MPQTPRLALPLLAAGQSQKDVTHNEALLGVDRLVALTVVSRSVATPPASAAEGEAWIVPAAGVAAWGQPAGTLMHRQGSGWLAQTPRDGQQALVGDEIVLLVHAAGWKMVRRVEAPAVLALPTGGVSVDSEVRTAFAAMVVVLQRQGLIV